MSNIDRPDVILTPATPGNIALLIVYTLLLCASPPVNCDPGKTATMEALSRQEYPAMLVRQLSHSWGILEARWLTGCAGAFATSCSCVEVERASEEGWPGEYSYSRLASGNRELDARRNHYLRCAGAPEGRGSLCCRAEEACT
jgi:hypothetical protein